ncbi:MAG: phosphatase PAP2 family protein [Clostridiales bacterium]|nr:phosphatase PAP2 family protein [Clostridiales bacterium]
MKFLHLLESIRTPFLDSFFSLVTQLGELTVFLVIAVVILWCVDKKWAYRIIFAGLCSMGINQSLKAVFKIPRPWLLDPSFNIVESAREAATGYSFPSGHTQTAVTLFGCIAVWIKCKWTKALCIVLLLLVGFSRLYLGVHTPLDVGVAALIGLASVLTFAVMSKKSDSGSEKKMLTIMWILVGVCTLLQMYTAFFLPKTAGSIEEFDLHAVENAYTMGGAIIALVISWVLDRKYIKYEVKAVWWAQIIKVAIGLALTVGVKSGLKAPISALFDGHFIGDGIRYFLTVLMMGTIWPLTFKFWSKLGKKNQAE